jgi:hypothetical protein
MTRAAFAVYASLHLSKDHDYDLKLALAFGAGPKRITLGPHREKGKPPLRPSIGEMIEGIAEVLGYKEQLGPVAGTKPSWPWSKLFEIEVEPEVAVEVSNEPAVSLVLKLFEGDEEGINLPGKDKPSWLTIEPEFTVYELIVSYDPKGGFDMKALVEFKSQPKALTAGGGGEEGGKKELVSYPFPTPPPASENLQIKYVGLGQRFGPRVDPSAEDPLKGLFDELEEKLTSNDPKEVLTTLAKYYDPDAGWFFGADISLRGWEVRAVLADPSLYGLEITCENKESPFYELKFEILYQKLGSGVGVFYGELTLPVKFRTIQLGIVSLTLPSFKIWIYTNGDFKVSVGWPLGPNSIGVQVYVFTGGGGFYFAKLRSADKPDSGGKALRASNSELGKEIEDFNPIIEFGLGLWFGVGRSFSYGPFSASLSVTLQGTFQGLLAWKAPAEGESTEISKAPDYHWFAATLGVVGVLQGEVDLKIIKISVLVELRATAGIAFETEYGTQFTVEASVHVEASVKILIVRISVGFSASIRETFTLSSSQKGNASLEGPRNPAFQGMNDWALVGLDRVEQAVARESAPPVLPASFAEPLPEPPAEPPARTEVEVGLLLQPAAVYSKGSGAGCGLASLVVDAEAAEKGKKAPLELLVEALAVWLLDTFAKKERKWGEVVAALEPKRKPGTPNQVDPPGWEKALEGFVAERLRLVISGVDLTAKQADGRPVAFLPMLEDLEMSWTGGKGPVVFADQARTWPNYVSVVDEYFAQLSLNGLTSNPTERRQAPAGLAAGEGEEPTGAPLAQMIFADHFLTVARHLAQEMKGEPAGAMPRPEQAQQAGGIGSRYLLNGMRLPDPAKVPPSGPVDLEDLELASGYALTGQQFPLGSVKDKCEATVKVRPNPGRMAAAIAFATGEAATATMPVEAVPPAPLPVWSGPAPLGLAAGGGTISLTAVPPASSRDLWVTARTRLPWQDGPAETPFVVPLPPEIAEKAAAPGEEGLRLEVVEKPPTTPPGLLGGGEVGETKALKVRPALLVQVTAHRVDRPRVADLEQPPAPGAVDGKPASPEAKSRYVPFVYRLDGTDDATRAQLSAALAAGALGEAEVSVLYDDPEKTGYRSEPNPVLLAKTNLSTSSQPARFAAIAEAEPQPEGRLGPTAAGLGDVAGVARLLWELSVVQSAGFYLRYANADGKDLPETIFHASGAVASGEERTGDAAPLTVAIVFPEGTPLRPWHNAFLTNPGPEAGSLYLRPERPATGPLQTLHPTYPAGCVGFEGVWARAELLAEDGPDELWSADWAAQLYHLLQFRVSGKAQGSDRGFHPSLWSAALSPISDPGESGPSDRYRQVLPAFRFLEGAGGEPQPYAAVGGKVELAFQTGDVFGNVLEEGLHEGPLAVLYNDPLLGPDEWPGVRVGHSFRPGGDGKQLRLDLGFDPEAVVRKKEKEEDPPPVKQAEEALVKVRTAIAQLDDPNTALSLLTTVLPGEGEIGDAAAIKRQLREFAEAIEAQLVKVAEEKGEAKEVSKAIESPLDVSLLGQLPADVVPVKVTLKLARPPELVYESDGGPVKNSLENEIVIAPELEAGESVRLRSYAEAFEAAFANWDGAGGSARLAVRSDRQDLGEGAALPPLSALRISAAKGIDVHLEAGKAAYFSLAPLNVELVGGTAEVPVYDAELKVEKEDKMTFGGIDLDLWGEAFLAAMDEALSPAIGTTVAALDPATYGELMLAKSVLAEALAAGVEPVYEGEGALAGDRDSAREAFRQAVLGRLSAAFSLTAIAQVPAAVKVPGGIEPRDAHLYGTVAAAGIEGTATLGSAKLALRESEPGKAFLSFPVTVAQEGRSRTVEISPTWSSRFLERRTEEAGAFEYKPTEWLRVVRELKQGEKDPLDHELGTLEVPVPSRHYPAAPVLSGQSAQQAEAEGEGLAAYLRWNYGTRMELPSLQAQDTLWLDVAYNEPLSEPQRFGFDGGEPNLFEALASFTVAWTKTLRPLLEKLPETKATAEPAPSAVIDAFWQQAKLVTRAWAREFGVDDPWAEGGEKLAAAAPKGNPEKRVDRYAIDFACAFGGGPTKQCEERRPAGCEEGKPYITVYAQAPGAAGECEGDKIVWPLINGRKPCSQPVLVKVPPQSVALEGEACWYKAGYEFTAADEGPTSLQLEWQELSVLDRQTGRASCWLTRNADLAGASGPDTNPAFVYKTPEIGFPNPVVPTIVVSEYGPLPPENTLTETLKKVLEPLGPAGTGVSAERLVKLSAAYSYALPAPQGAEPVRSSIGILLADQVPLSPQAKEGEPGENSITLAKLCDQVASDCKAWYSYFKPVTTEARLGLMVALFADVAGAQLPLIQIQDLELEASPGWWKP